jgi:hypothetical protein
MRRYIEILALVIAVSLLGACGSNNATSSNSPAATQPPGTAASINLSWNPPVTRTDGSYLPVGDLAGFRVYMGTSSGNLTPYIDLDSGDINEFTIKNLSSGSYYFAISAFDTDGQESGLSQVILRQVG